MPVPTMKEKALPYFPYVPAVFCACLTAITMVMSLWISFANHTAPEATWMFVFLCNLPLCFMWLGTAIANSQKEIRKLQKQIIELQGKSGGS